MNRADANGTRCITRSICLRPANATQDLASIADSAAEGAPRSVPARFVRRMSSP